jgi:hypothetical protein
MSYYGISVKVILNQQDKILNMQTGEFYSTWIICGAGNGHLPNIT